MGEIEREPALVSEDAEALDNLKRFNEKHKLDPNLPEEQIRQLDSALHTSDSEKSHPIAGSILEENDSPYPEVRAAVRNYDVDVPSNTIRAWVIGLVLCTIGSAINMLFSLRNPSVQITTYFIQILAYFCGRGWDFVMPDKEFKLFGQTFNLKPGPFNFKEHTVIIVMSNAAYGGGVLYATDVLVAQQVFYKQNFGWGFQMLFGITTLCTGFGIAGLARRFLVWPAAMIWPGDLVNSTVIHALHDHAPSDPSKTHGWKIGRYKFFMLLTAGGFIWYWFPGWIFQGLSYFTFFCWAFPNNVTVNKIFGGLNGYGILPLTFDWTVVSGYALSPLIPPFHAIANTVVGVFIFFVAVSMGLHFTDTWHAQYFPVQSSDAFDNTGKVYDVSRIMTPELTLDVEKYHNYSPVFLSTQYALCYGLSFAAVAAVVVHTALYHGKDIVKQFKQSREQGDDIHMKMMCKYEDVKDWWYGLLFVVMIGLSFVVVCAWPTNFPAWAYVVCILIPLVWTLPIGIVQAITNIQLGLNVLTEFIIGYMLPGRPMLMMMFKNYGYITMSQALYFAQDLKLGHYMKVPPRTMFASQLVATVWSAIVQIAVMNWALGSIPDVCSSDQPNNYTCPGGTVFYTASIIWGAIGPARIFSNGATYSSLQWFWLAGGISPFITYLLARKWPRSLFRYVSMPMIFGGAGMIPPATVYTYFCWGLFGFVFNFVIKRRFPGWWLQYNYVTSAALDCGLILSTVIIFFTLYLTSATPPQWYGNVGALETLDMSGGAVSKVVGPGETFGPKVWP